MSSADGDYCRASTEQWSTGSLREAGPEIALDMLSATQRLRGLTFHYVDLATSKEYTSENYEQIFGLPPVGTFSGLREYVHPEDQGLFDETLHAARTRIGRVSMLYRVAACGHAYRNIKTRAETVPDRSGRPARILLTSRDSSHREAIELDRLATADRLERVQTAAHIGAWEWNFINGEATWSEAAWSLLEPGGSGEVTLERWLNAIHPDDRETARQQTHIALETGNFRIEYRVLRPDGTIRWMRSMGSTRYAVDGKPQLMRGVLWDVTENKLAQQALQEADRRKDEFLATLAHELRNPLAPLQTAADIMRHLDNGDARLATIRRIVEQQTSHLTRLVDDLLDVSRLASGKLNLRKTPIDICDAINAAVEMCRAEISARGHRLNVALPVSAIRVAGDQFRVTQVVANLLGNAIKYTPNGGTIALRAYATETAARIEIEDNGIGIAADFLPRLFEAFTQAAEQRDKAAGGLGLGLMLVHQIVGLHGGHVTAESAGLGRGAHFAVELPLLPATSDVSTPDQDAARRLEPSSNAIKVLVVDDYEAIRDSMAIMLSMQGYEVSTAADGKAALAAVSSVKPDVVLLDLRMPEMSGYDIARAIRKLPGGRSIVLIAMTGTGTENRSLSLDAGFDEHLVKPVPADSLASLLTRLTNSQRAVA